MTNVEAPSWPPSSAMLFLPSMDSSHSVRFFDHTAFTVAIG
jgi:hypothetical protein